MENEKCKRVLYKLKKVIGDFSKLETKRKLTNFEIKRKVIFIEGMRKVREIEVSTKKAKGDRRYLNKLEDLIDLTSAELIEIGELTR